MTGLSDAAAGWLLELTGCAAVAGERVLVGGWTSDMRRVRLRDDAGGERDVVLRRMFREPWRSYAAEMLAREASVFTLLEGSAVTAPRLVGVDPDGANAGAPALAMTLLPGRPVLALPTDDDVGELARTLVELHRVVPPERPRAYESWATPDRTGVPGWACDPGLWSRAAARIERPAPPYTGCFIHRDFHPGNVLWAGGRVSGVVDWVETSWGPPNLDVAHCATNLALLHAPAAAERFRAAYVAAGGRLDDDPEHRAYWELIDVLGLLPDPDKVGIAWRAAGRTELRPALLRRRCERYLAAVLARV